jgi:hypothetical protein
VASNSRGGKGGAGAATGGVGSGGGGGGDDVDGDGGGRGSSAGGGCGDAATLAAMKQALDQAKENEVGLLCACMCDCSTEAASQWCMTALHVGCTRARQTHTGAVARGVRAAGG